MATVGVVGGGIAGAAAAYALADAPVDVTLFEAADRLGGRTTTRERGGCIYDYGANYVKGADERFRAVLREAVGEALVTVEGDVWVFDADGSVRAGREDQAPKYTTRRGVRGIVEGFVRASGATVERGTRVGHLDWTSAGWRLTTSGGEEVAVDALVLATPAGATASLLADADWGHQLRADVMEAADRVPHRPVDSVVLHYPERVERPFYGLVSADKEHDVGWLSREECKPGHVPEGESLLVVQSSPAWTARHLDADAATVERVAREAAVELLDAEWLAEPDWTDHERWTAAVPNHGVNPGLVERLPRQGLAVAGDWVAGTGRTYAALQTGLDAADRVRDHLAD